MFYIDAAMLAQASADCGAGSTALMGAGCLNATGSIFDRLVTEMLASARATRLIQVSNMAY